MMTENILYGGDPKPQVDYKSLGAFFFYSAEKYKDRICQIDGTTGKTETYGSVKQRITRCAIELRHRGVTKTDLILVCSSDHLNNTIPFIAGLYLGAKVSTIDPSLTVRDAAHLISLVKPTYIFVEETAVELIEKCLEKVNLEAEIVVMGDGGSKLSFEEFQKESSEEEMFEPVEIEDGKETAVVLFSSGTSGLAKSVCLSHVGFLPYKQDNDLPPLGTLNFSTMAWISSITMLTINYLCGTYRIIVPKFEPVKTLELIAKYKIFVMILSPTYTCQIMGVKNPEQYDVSSVRMVFTLGAYISAAQIERARNFFKYSFVAQSYGLTEAGGELTSFSLERDAEVYKTKLASSGKATPGVHIKIVDTETGAILGPNQRGEIYFKSRSIMNGYCNQDSSAVFDQDNFCKTGDIGYYDEDEFLYVVERTKDIFKYRSWQIVPAILEAALQEHPAVHEAVVFDLPHEIDNSHAAACVTLKAGEEATPEELEEFVRERVSEVQRIRGGIKIVEEIPKTPTEKVLRRKMKELFLNGQLG